MVSPTVNPYGVEPLTPDELARIEQGFWTRTPELALIAVEAEKIKASPWGLYGQVLANAASLIPFYVELPTKFGDPPTRAGMGGSMNFGVLFPSESGTGKTETGKTAERLLPPHENTVPKGTSAGWIKMLVGKETIGEKDDKETVRVRRAWTLNVATDEFGGQLQEFARSGSQTSASIREMVMGTRTGNVTGDVQRDNYVPSGSYRFVCSGAVQAELMGPMFTPEEIAAGTPQRFFMVPAAWDGPRSGVAQIAARSLPQFPIFPLPNGSGGAVTVTSNGIAISNGPAVNSNVSDDNLPAPFPLRWSPQCRAEIKAAEANAEIRGYFPTLGMTPAQRDEHRAEVSMRHAMLLRVKVAQLNATIHGRQYMDDLDWELSGIAIRVHRGVLAGIFAVLAELRGEQVLVKGAELGAQREATTVELERIAEANIIRVADGIWERLAQAGTTGTPYGVRPSHRYRRYVDDAIQSLQEAHLGRSGRGLYVTGDAKRRKLTATYDGRFLYRPDHISEEAWAARTTDDEEQLTIALVDAQAERTRIRMQAEADKRRYASVTQIA